MKHFLIAVLALFSTEAMALRIGDVAPNFSLKSINDKTVSLSDYKGKLVVVEFYSHKCPFVFKHYSSGNMPSLQKYYTNKDVVWLSINSSAEGHPYAHNNEEAHKYAKKYSVASTEILKDPTGEVGKAYKAVTTPHMYIITADGKLAYQGAIDNKPSFRVKDVEGAQNYVKEALDAILDKKEVVINQTRPYGCSIKYAK